MFFFFLFSSLKIYKEKLFKKTLVSGLPLWGIGDFLKSESWLQVTLQSWILEFTMLKDMDLKNTGFELTRTIMYLSVVCTNLLGFETPDILMTFKAVISSSKSWLYCLVVVWSHLMCTRRGSVEYSDLIRGRIICVLHSLWQDYRQLTHQLLPFDKCYVMFKIFHEDFFQISLSDSSLEMYFA